MESSLKDANGWNIKELENGIAHIKRVNWITIEKAKFRKYNEGQSRDIIPVALNSEEREQLEKLKDALHESKDSTALKQAALKIAPIVLQDTKTKAVSDLAVANFRRAYRIGALRRKDI